jgi:hypothetical protein
MFVGLPRPHMACNTSWPCSLMCRTWLGWESCEVDLANKVGWGKGVPLQKEITLTRLSDVMVVHND